MGTWEVSRVKRQRQQAILDIIEQHVIETQDDLVAALHAQGLPVTQATVSRDIKELRLAKVATADGKYRYALPAGGNEQSHDVKQRAQRAFDEYVLTIESTHHLVLVKTLPGSAPMVAVTIDDLGIEGILGTVAGDDTILVVVADSPTEL